MRFLHSADWQLGMTRHFLDDDAQPRYTAARTDVVRSLGALARAQACELVLVCGDVFESNQVSPRVVSRSLAAMGEIGIPVYLLPGNHDPVDAASVYSSPAFSAAVPPNVQVLRSPGPHEVRPGVQIVAAPWHSRRPVHDLVAEVVEPLPPDGVLRVVAGHGPLDVTSADPTDPARIRLAPLERALAHGAVHYVALGDRHSTTDVGASGAIWYPGTPEVTDYDEVDPGNVLVVDVEPGRPPRVERYHVGTWAFHDVAADLACDADVEDLDARLRALNAPERAVVRLSLVGSLSMPAKARLDAVLERHERVLASLAHWDKGSDLVVYADDDALSQLGVSGFAASALRELAEAARVGGPQGQTARDALSLVHRLAAGAR